MNKYPHLSTLFALFTLLFTVSCSQTKVNSNYQIITEFPQIITLPAGDTCAVFDTDYGLLDLSSAGAYLIGTLRKRSHFFSVYTSDTIPELMGSFGTQGKGPEEMMAPAYFGQWSSEQGQTKIWLLDRVKAELIKVNLDSTIHSNRTIIEQRYDLASDGIPDVRNLFFVNDTLLVGTAESPTCPIFRYNPRTKNLTYSAHAQLLEGELSPQILQEITQNLCAFDPVKKRIASAFFSFPQIDFRQVASTEFHTLFIHQILTPKNLITQPRKTYYASICGTQEYIYALWIDQNDDDFGEATKPTCVHIYNWDGTPVAQLNLPSYTLGITVDPTHNKLYTINYYQDANSVVAYDLNTLIGHEM